ncbi:unnamed protein product [Ascophyllum nodosum]
MGEIYTAQQSCGGDMTRVTLPRKADRVSFVVPLVFWGSRKKVRDPEAAH